MLQFIQAHLALATTVFAICWTVIPSIAAVGVSKLDKTTFGHALLSAVAGAGFNGPMVLDALKRMSASALRIPLTVTVLVAAVTGVTVASLEAGCAFWQHEQPTVVTDLSSDGECVLEEVLAGTTDPALVAGKCGVQAAGQLGQIIADMISYYTRPQDGGVGASPPPYKGMPATISASDYAKLVAFQGQLEGR